MKEVAQNKQRTRETERAEVLKAARQEEESEGDEIKTQDGRTERGGESDSLAECLQEILLFDE